MSSRIPEHTSAEGSSSRTTTYTERVGTSDRAGITPAPLILSLVASSSTPVEGDASQPSAPRVRWDDDVIDNEGLGRKKSKGIPV